MIRKQFAYLFLIIIWGLLLALPAQAAEPVRATLEANRNEITIGDPVQLTLEVVHPAGSQIIIPQLEQTWGPFEVQQQSAATTVTNPDGTQTTSQVVTVTLFEPGSFETPSLPLTLTGNGGQVTEISPTPITLTVKPTLAEDDTTLKDIRPQVDMTLPSRWRLVAGGLVTAMAMAGGALWLYYRWTRQPRLAVVDNRLPYQIAYDELTRIEGLHLPEKGQFKEHYTLATDCLRGYLERQFQISAFEYTTTELKAALRNSTLGPDQARQFIDLFMEGDLVKFSKIVPEIEEAYQLLKQARKLVELTRPELAAEPTGQVRGTLTTQPQKTMEVIR